MIGDIAFGQFIPGKSPLHRMDPRVKIVLIFLFIVFLFVAQNFVALALPVLAALAAILPNAARIARYLDNRMLEERRPNRRDTW